MHSSFEFGTFANYSPRGTNEFSTRSRNICGKIKGGEIALIERVIPFLKDTKAAILVPFLNPNVVLIPTPRSAPLVEGSLWPSKLIADILVSNGYGAEVRPILIRTTAVKKSSTSPSKERPLIDEHYSSMEVQTDLIAPTQITLIDDVLTQGRTTYAGAMRLKEAFPQARIRVFAIFRTLGTIPEIDTVFDPTVGSIIGYPSGKSFRDP